MTMRNLLFGVMLGLLAVVHSAPTDTVTLDDVYQEVQTDGYLIHRSSLSASTTESPKRNATVPATQQLKEDDITEGSGEENHGYESTTSMFLQLGGEHYATTAPSVSRAQSSTTELTEDTRESGSYSSTTQNPQFAFTSSSGPEKQAVTQDDVYQEAQTDGYLIHHPAPTSLTSESRRGNPTVYFPSIESGSGEEENDEIPPTMSSVTSVSNEEKGIASSTPTAFPIAPRLFEGSEGSGSGSGSESGSGDEEGKSSQDIPEATSSTSTAHVTSDIIHGESDGEGSRDKDNSALNHGSRRQQRMPEAVFINQLPDKAPVTDRPHHPGHTTPGWIIIVGFIVGVAALVMVCVAIATRDKWNGPNQATMLQTKTESSNQQRELEMETFLHKDKPRENGKAADYTVIPLDELPEKDSSL